ncbi:MAG: transposase domain-containing protein [Gammaproteobacteria bacterium]|nr:transposase domain-containing protein [Gammaproteobacteria bacterium]
MFSNSAKETKASTNLYSLVETAKANGIEPSEYINNLLTNITTRQAEDDLSELMPWNL